MSEAKRAGNGNDGHPTMATEPQGGEQEAPRTKDKPASGAELRQRIDQMGTILAKGLDLAEAGVSLGVTILSRVGVAAQQKLREGMETAANGPVPPPPMDEAGDAPDGEAEPAYGITNRLPLTPGGDVRISFSVNNDSMTDPKKVELRVESFVGEAQGARIDSAGFVIKPAVKTIAPVDFEKFILQGSVPAATTPDVYRGAVIVAADKELTIPVVLVVMPL